ncbi:hypothetical protein AB9K41_23615 [Cribrihabitans sp. XS_ASV171]
MAQKSKMPSTAQSPGFPKEAFDYNDDVRADVVADIKRDRGVKIEVGDEWEMVDGFGQVIYA